MSNISIIVPIYNAEKYLERCINSILVQTFTDFELILINDGSTDQSAEIIDRYAQKDPRVVAIHQKNSGVSAARNTGIHAAKGKYIGFVDADDTVEPMMYQKLYKSIEHECADIAMVGWSNIADEKKEVVELLEKDKKYSVFEMDELLEKIFCQNKRAMLSNVWNKLFKASHVKKNYFDTALFYGEDAWYSYQLIMKSKKIVCINEALYNYYIYQGSASHGGVTGEKRITHATVFKTMSVDLRKKGYTDLADQTFAYFVDLLLRDMNEAQDSKENIVLLKKKFREQWYEILKCPSIRFKLKISYLLHMLKV